MKKILLIGPVLAVLSLLVVFWVIPALAQEPTNGESTPTDQRTWETMHEACEEGAWESMAEAAQEMHVNPDYASCHGDEYPAADDSVQAFPNRCSDTGSHMGGSMMGSTSYSMM